MKSQEQNYVRLENFEGPLEFLLYLAQKEEIDLSDIRLKAITELFLQEIGQLDVESGAEFIGLTANLLWLKSRLLLPKEQLVEEELETEGPDPHFDIIHQLIDYCRFKQAGKGLVQLEHEQQSFFPRGGGTAEVKKPLGIDHLSLEDLASLFQEILVNAKEKTGQIFEENYRVSDKIYLIRSSLKRGDAIAFSQLFSAEMGRQELIVTFLAILELMKEGLLAVVRREEEILIISQKDMSREPRD